MPAVSAPAKVLVTGGSGFLGAWIIKRLLEQGFSVKAAVRNDSKAEYLKEFFLSHANQLETIIVKDFVAPGAFDVAVQGVDAIIHAAAPMPSTNPLSDPAENLNPAIKGTIGILESALSVPTIKRVVFTSSAVTVWEPKSERYTYTEADWLETSSKNVAAKGRDASSYDKYSAAKTQAEKAAWDWVKRVNPSFDIVTLLPAYIWGEIIHEKATEVKAASSNYALLNSLTKDAIAARKPDQLFDGTPFVDVRDTAEHHILALTKPEAGGERFLDIVKTISNQEIYDILNSDPIDGVSIPVGEPEKQKDFKPFFSFSIEKAQRLLGATYRPAEDTIRTTVLNGVNIGWRQ